MLKNVDQLEPYPTESPGAAITRHATAGLAGLIPVAGGSLSSIVMEAFQHPLSKRQEDWLNQVGHAVSDTGARLDALAGDDDFVDVVVVATEVARASGQEEKRQWLANAVANCARESSPGQAERLRFLRMIERLLPIHVHILRFITSGKLEYCHPADAAGNWPRIGDVLAQEMSELAGAGDFAQELWDDLINLGLVPEVTRTVLTPAMLELDRVEPAPVPDFRLPEPSARCRSLLAFIEQPVTSL